MPTVCAILPAYGGSVLVIEPPFSRESINRPSHETYLRMAGEFPPPFSFFIQMFSNTKFEF